MRRLFIGTALSLAMVASAAAADLPIYTKAPVAAYDWTGFYLGGGASYSWGRITDTGSYLPGFSGTTTPATTTRSIDHTIRGIDGEIQGGYRRQFGTAVLGIEAVARLTDQSGTGTCFETYPGGYPTTTAGIPALNTTGGTFSCYKGTRLNSTEALLFQAGVLVTPQLLVQVSGGPAAGQIHTDDALAFTYSSGAVTSGYSSQSTNKGGYWVGGGAEYAISSNLHLKLEYYHMDFGNVDTTTTWTDTTIFCTPTASRTACVSTFTNGRRVTDDSVMIGFNYIFGGGGFVGAPIYTKY
ncbi:MAG: outer membrane protein [Xanthobacteraceae bacterium]